MVFSCSSVSPFPLSRREVWDGIQQVQVLPLQHQDLPRSGVSGRNKLHLRLLRRWWCPKVDRDFLGGWSAKASDRFLGWQGNGSPRCSWQSQRRLQIA